MLKPRKPFFFASGLTAVAVAAALLLYMNIRRGQTAHASPAPELLSALPAGAPTLIYLDLAAVRASEFYRHRPELGPLTMPDRDYADFVKSTGFDFEQDLDRVAIASWSASAGKEQKQNVVIAEGRFDRSKIRAYALRKGKLDRQEGREVFLFPSDNNASSSSITFLDDHRLAIVGGTSIASLFAAGSDEAAADPARERAARLDGAAAFAITRVPPIPDNFAPGGAQSGQLAGLVRSIRWVTLAARPEGEDMRISLEGECDNGEDARQLHAVLEGLRMIGRAELDSPKAKQSMQASTYSVLQTILSNAEVTESGERVRIMLELTPDIFKLSEPKRPSSTSPAQ